jgi:hypothetical protein
VSAPGPVAAFLSPGGPRVAHDLQGQPVVFDGCQSLRRPIKSLTVAVVAVRARGEKRESDFFCGMDLDPMPDRNRKTSIFIIGAPKCATTAIARAVSAHPQIAFCRIKEPRFFSNDGCFAQGLDWYHGLFGAGDGLRAEASTSYGDAWMDRHRLAAARIHVYNPSAHIIYCVRHPLLRAISEWREISHQLICRNPYIEELYGIQRQSTADCDLRDVPGYIDTSNYWQTISLYRQYFDDSQIHVVFQKDWARTPDAELARICRFVGIDDQFQPRQVNAVVNDKWLKAPPGQLLSMARRIPGYRTVVARLPTGIKVLIRPLIKKHPDENIDISTETLMSCYQRIGADIDRFLEWQGRSPTHWSWWKPE